MGLGLVLHYALEYFEDHKNWEFVLPAACLKHEAPNSEFKA